MITPISQIEISWWLINATDNFSLFSCYPHLNLKLTIIINIIYIIIKIITIIIIIIIKLTSLWVGTQKEARRLNFVIVITCESKQIFNIHYKSLLLLIIILPNQTITMTFNFISILSLLWNSSSWIFNYWLLIFLSFLIQD